MTHEPEPSAEYVAARRVLLDTLILLRDQLDAFVLVGAQAVYLRAPFGDPRPMYTTDGDLLIDPDLLARHPDLGAELAAAGFTLGRHGNPGHWISPDGIVIDLMVASGSLPRSTCRTALLAGQATTTARRTDGLELALVDNTAMTLPPSILETGVPSPSRWRARPRWSSRRAQGSASDPSLGGSTASRQRTRAIS